MPQVENQPRISDFRCGGTEAGHMWAESENDQASALYLEAALEDVFRIDDISSVFYYETNAKKGKTDALSLYMPGEEIGGCAVFEGVSCDEEVANLPLAVCLSKASEDQIFNVDFTKKVPELDSKFFDELSYGYARPANSLTESGFEVSGLSESSVQVPKFQKSTDCAMYNVRMSNCGDGMKVEDEMESKFSKDRMGIILSNISGKPDVLKKTEAHYFKYEEASPFDQGIKEDLLLNHQSTKSCFWGDIASSRQKMKYNRPKKYVEELQLLKPRRGRPRKHASSIESGFEVAGLSESSVQVPKFQKSTDCAMLNVSMSNCGDETKLEDEMGLKCSKDRMSIILSNINNEHYLQYEEISPFDQCIKEDVLLNHESTKSCSGGGIASSRQKRKYNRPQKYVEELQLWKPRRGQPRKHASSVSKDEDLGVGLQMKLREKSLKRISLKESDSDEDYKPHASSNFRRSYQMKWTLDEVLKLVDGVAHFGNKWTSIQRSFFSSSGRTPTDIRDKWRNLVKTNCSNLKRKAKNQHLRKHILCLPTAVTERVRELANGAPQYRRKLSDVENYQPDSSLPE